MTRVALIGSVDCNIPHFSQQQFDRIIAVDKGFDTLMRKGITPDEVVGDFDSLGYIPSAPNVMVHPPEKDQSDMELACDRALELGATEVMIYGGMAKRLDHTLANMQIMRRLARQGVAPWAVGEGFITTAISSLGVHRVAWDAFDPVVLDDAYRLDAKPCCDKAIHVFDEHTSYGRFISVFAAGGTACGVTIGGLKYSLEKATLADDMSLGLSNEFTGAQACISVEQGTLDVIFPEGAWKFLSR